MKYSEKLNGFYEEGYHYYIEIRNERMTVRDYRRAVALETTVCYNADDAELGRRTEIYLEDNVLSRAADGSMMTQIKSLFFEGGELKLLYYYTIMGETLYTLKKVEHGPFDHITVRDTEFLEALQGKWTQWLPNGEKGSAMMIMGNRLSWMGMGPFAFHAVSLASSPNRVRLVPENLIDGDFGGFTSVDVEKDMLTTRMIVCDASVPLTVFARDNMLNRITPPPAAFEKMRGTMLPPDGERTVFPPMRPAVDAPPMRPAVDMPPMRPAVDMPPETCEPPKGAANAGNGEGSANGVNSGNGESPGNGEKSRNGESAGSAEGARTIAKFCRECGYAFGEKSYKFCPNCGAKR